MTDGANLRNQLTEAWKQAIEGDYRRQRINSERSLQASFWARLNTILPDSARMFIEPSFRIDGIACTPDLVICDVKQIVAIKYTPRNPPSKWQKDVETLERIIANRDAISLHNRRFCGVTVDDVKYSLAENALLVWAGVHRPCPPFLKASLSAGLKDCFFELHAETFDNEHPRISWE